jgi:hypothetical protein
MARPASVAVRTASMRHWTNLNAPALIDAFCTLYRSWRFPIQNKSAQFRCRLLIVGDDLGRGLVRFKLCAHLLDLRCLLR